MDHFKTYRTWHAYLKQIQPDRCPSRLQNMALLIVGLFHARRIHASAIVRKWPLHAKVVSLTRRLSRFLANPGVDVRAWYRPVAQQVLAGLAAGGEIRLILDGSKVGFEHQLLMVAVAFRGRALPLAWCWVKGTRGHSSARTQLALLSYVRGLLPPTARVLVVGDTEFGSVTVMRQLVAWHWFFALRQKGSHLVKVAHARTWRACADWAPHPGAHAWLPQARLTQKWSYHTNLLAYWAPGEKEPWLLATNLPSPRATLQAYARRMWIEELFGDLKQHGFDLEATHLRHFLRLSRLTLAVCLLYVWLVLTGRRVIKSGLRHLVDRRERRDLSLFRIGWDFMERRLALQRPVTVSLTMPVSGS